MWIKIINETNLAASDCSRTKTDHCARCNYILRYYFNHPIFILLKEYCFSKQKREEVHVCFCGFDGMLDELD